MKTCPTCHQTYPDNVDSCPRDGTRLSAESRDERECPYCAEMILNKARVCKHCGREVEPLTVGGAPVQVPLSAPPQGTPEIRTPQPQTSKPVGAGGQPTGSKTPWLRAKPEPPSKMKYVVTAVVALILVVAGAWYFSQHGSEKGEVRLNLKEGLKTENVTGGGLQQQAQAPVQKQVSASESQPSESESCKALEKVANQATVDHGASLESAWNAIVAEKGRKHANILVDSCVQAYFVLFQGFPAEVLEAHRIPVQPDDAYIDSVTQILRIDAAVLKTPVGESEMIATLNHWRTILESNQAELLPNFIKVEVGRHTVDPASGSWEPSATITNRSSISPLSHIYVPLLEFDSNKTLIWEGAFQVNRLEAGGKADVIAHGKLIPGDLIPQGTGFYHIGKVRLAVN